MTISLFKGAESPFKSGRVVGRFRRLRRMLYKAVGALRLAFLNFSAPTAQEFPTTAAGLATLLGDDSATPSYIWDCQEASGNLVDSVGSVDLTTTVGSAPLQGQTAVGLWNGSAYASRNAVEFPGNAYGKEATSSTSAQPGVTSFAALLVYRNGVLGTSNAALVGKQNATSGWRIEIRNNGNIRANVDDGTTPLTVSSAASDASDGAWHWAAIVINRTTNTLYVYTDAGSAGSGSISGFGTLNSTKAFGIGQLPGVALAPNLGSTQIAYVAAFEGAAAEAIDQTALDNFWQHATDPTGLLTTQTRSTLISVPVSSEHVAHFAPNTLPIGYNSAFTDTNKLGLYCNSAIENLIGYSEDGANWNNNNSTDSSDFADSPDGFRSANELTATSNGGYHWRNSDGTETALKDYTLSVWVKRNGGSDVDGVIRLLDLDDASNTGVAYTATDTWQRISVTHDMSATVSAGMRCQIEINTSGESILWWGMQMEEGDSPTAYIRTLAGSAVTLGVSVYYATVTGAYNSLKGEARCTVVRATSGVTENHMFNLARGAGAIPNLHYYRFTPTQSSHAIFGDSASAEVQLLHVDYSPNIELTLRGIWDMVDGAGPDSQEMAVVMNGTTYETSGYDAPGDDTTEASYDFISVGGRMLGDGQLNGFVQDIEVYDQQNGDIP